MKRKELVFLKKLFFEAFDRFGTLDISRREKGAFDCVTNIDLAIENYIIEETRKAFPGDWIHSEETLHLQELKDRTWIFDPIDGTYNFSTGSEHFAIQGALWENGVLQASAIYLPRTHEFYEASLGEGAFCNGERIRISDRKPEDSILSFGDFSHRNPENARRQKLMMERVFPHVAKFRLFGSAAVDFTRLARGCTEGTVLITKNKYDLAPGVLLAAEAGAYLYGLCGEPYHFECDGIIAVNHPNLMEILKENTGGPNDSGQ